MSEDAFIGYQGVDLYDPEKLTPAASANMKTFRVFKKMKPPQLLELLAESYGVNIRKLRLWPFTMRTNKAIRPAYLDLDPEICKPLEESQFGQTLPFFLEMLPADDEREALPSFSKDNDVILFLKFYDPVSETLHYMGHWCINISITFTQVGDECRRRAHFTPDTPISLYEEINTGRLEKVLNLNVGLDQGLDELMDGDIIVFHRTFEPSRKSKSLLDFYTYIQYK